MCKYDLFFYGTVCHVCKAKVQVKRCSACKMIAYCSATHQKEHWHFHKRVCKCIQKLIAAETWKMNIFYNRKPQVWTELMMMVELNLERELLPVERQMFWFARKCEVCYEFEQDKLEDCPNCASASYCIDTKCRTLDSQHAAFCFQLNLGFQLDKYLMQYRQPFLLPPVDSKGHLPCNIEAFVANMFSESDYINLNLPPHLAVPLFTEALSCPLTLVYSLEVLGMREKCELVVHVVGAADVECSFIALWETVLHCLPQLKDLFIAFIGPECWYQETKELCSSCRDKGRSLRIVVHAQLYHQYASSAEYLKPHVVVMFNCGLHQTQGSHDDSWAPSIPLLSQESPLVLTSYTSAEATLDIHRLGRDLEKVIDRGVNPFCSLRPHRDIDAGHNKDMFRGAIVPILSCKVLLDKLQLRMGTTVPRNMSYKIYVKAEDMGEPHELHSAEK